MTSASIADPHLSAPAPSRARAGWCRNSSSDPHPRPRCIPPSAADPPAQRVLAPPPRSETVALLSKVPLKDRFQHVPQCRLHHPVRPSGSPRPFVRAARLGNPDPPHRLGPVTTLLQRFRQPFRGSPPNGARTSPPSGDPRPPPRFAVTRWSGAADCRASHLVHQAKPFASSHPRFEGRQHPLRPDRRFHPRPAGADLSGLLSRLRHCRRWLVPSLFGHVSTFLRSLRSIPVTGLPRYYGRSDSCRPGSSAPSGCMNSVSVDQQVSLIYVLDLPIPPSPTTP